MKNVNIEYYNIKPENQRVEYHPALHLWIGGQLLNGETKKLSVYKKTLKKLFLPTQAHFFTFFNAHFFYDKFDANIYNQRTLIWPGITQSHWVPTNLDRFEN